MTLSSIPFGPGVRLLAEHPNGLVVLDKPEGLASHPTGPGPEKDTLLKAAYDHQRECYRWPRPEGGMERLFLLNRLDSPTSGLILLCRGQAESERFKEMFKERRIHKTYVAAVSSHQPRCGLWEDELEKSRGDGHVRARAVRGGARAVCRTSLITADPSRRLSALLLEPETGLTHQLRVQCALRQHPIVGDRTYGDFAVNKALGPLASRLYLHAFRIEVPLGGGESFRVESPLPAAFKTLLPKCSV